MNDAELIRFTDEALNRVEHWRARRHVRSCAACTGRLDVLRRRDASLHERLQSGVSALPPLDDRVQAMQPRTGTQPSADRGAGSRWWAAAAAALLLVVVLVATPLVAMAREWVTTMLAGRSESVVHPAPAHDEAIDATHRTPPSAAAIRFVPTEQTLTVSFVLPESASTLVVIRGDAPDVIFENPASEMSPSAILVLPSGLEVRNAPRTGVAGVYRLWVPRSVRELRVFVSQRSVLHVHDPERELHMAISVSLAN